MTKTRKIIHIDMDCFYAAVEMRDNPRLRHKPIAVGGAAQSRSVLCTANYIARRYGIHSAMSSYQAQQRCPSLMILPVNMSKYREVAAQIRSIFSQYSDLIEPLSLDEAFLDVSDSRQHYGSATLIAETIRWQIKKQLHLTASAGVASNKFLAKVASDWQKPDGITVISPQRVKDFIRRLPVEKIFGVGKVTAARLHQLGVKTCTDLQYWSREALCQQFGRFGQQLYERCRGIDNRPVQNNRQRKSVSVEHTFDQDLPTVDACLQRVSSLYLQLLKRCNPHQAQAIHKQFVKIKFNNFQTTTVEIISQSLNRRVFCRLIVQGFQRQHRPVRLLGLGIGLRDDQPQQPLLLCPE